MGIVKTPNPQGSHTNGSAGWKYRFTLQWSAETAEKMLAGDFLESLGNRKSELVVMAINEYITTHPEILTAGNKLKIVVKPNITHEQIKSMVTALLEEKIAGLTVLNQDAGRAGSELLVTKTEIDEMLSNLELFSE